MKGVFFVGDAPCLARRDARPPVKTPFVAPAVLSAKPQPTVGGSREDGRPCARIPGANRRGAKRGKSGEMLLGDRSIVLKISFILYHKGMRQDSSRKNRPWRPWLVFAFACVASFATGWFLSGTGQQIVPNPIRLGGYQFINPLLSCNFSSLKVFPENQAMHNVIQSAIAKDVSAGKVSKASAYFADFTSGAWAESYNNEKYYPSSLGKIPIMMAYYELAENSSSILNEEITFPFGSPDLNATQDIQPLRAIVPGETYTVEQLIEYMAEDSDNNATALLTSHIDENALVNVYNDLQIPIDNDVTKSNADFMTPQQVSTLFRVLYNGTYLSHDYSEKALQLMSQSSFTQGLVAGLPTPTVVSHKLGLVGISSGGTTTEHELHDCGIIYAPNHPYLLCIMTRSSSTLPVMESAIADVSRAVYQQVTGY